MGITNFPYGLSSWGVPLYGFFPAPFWGNTYYVKKSTDADYATFRKKYDYTISGSTRAVHTTADSAFDAAASHDRIIFVSPDSGGHDLTTMITIDQFALKVYGDSTTQWTQKCTIKNPTAAATSDMFTVKTDKVEFFGLTFQNRKAGSCILIGDTAGQAYYQTHIHGCNFTDYGGVSTYGITPGNPTAGNESQVDTVNLVVEDCVFDSFVTAAIKMNGTRSAVLRNYFKVPAAGYGIHFDYHTDGRSYAEVAFNYFKGANSTDVGIKITDVDHAANNYSIHDNKFQGCATTITPLTYNNFHNNLNTTTTDGKVLELDLVT